MTDGDDPTVIRSLAIAVEDVLDAAVYNRENPGTAVLRVTPPFHGRMRARLHVYREDDRELTGAIHVPPRSFLPKRTRTAYPDFESRPPDVGSDGEDEDGPIDNWRSQARDSLRETVTIDTGEKSHTVSVGWLDEPQ
ncbi:hypothetical protein OB905_09940 [Halobacteria archaeon AArc-dxtr1]|nr:hypothetical protein [Halobacteria archaeon AArc-dxtr1]